MTQATFPRSAWPAGVAPGELTIIALEELAYACPVTANFALLTLTGTSSFIAKSGTEEQKQRYLPPLCDGSERFSISMTESDDGLPSRLDSSAAKIAATEAAGFITDTAMQLHGGTGMSQEMPLEWLYRVVRPYQVAGGTSDFLRSGMASELVGRRLEQRQAPLERSGVWPIGHSGERALLGSGEAGRSRTCGSSSSTTSASTE